MASVRPPVRAAWPHGYCVQPDPLRRAEEHVATEGAVRHYSRCVLHAAVNSQPVAGQWHTGCKRALVTTRSLTYRCDRRVCCDCCEAVSVERPAAAMIGHGSIDIGEREV